MTNILKLKEAMALAEEIVKKNPNNVSICKYTYFDGNVQHCLVGEILIKKGIYFDMMDSLNSESICSHPLLERVREQDLILEGDCLEFLTNLQAYQDNGYTWKIALRKAKCEIKSLNHE